MQVLAAAADLVFQPYVLMVILFSSIYGLFVGCIPGLTATMATALLVPITFFMPPVPAIAAIVSASAMAIFSGDIPGALLRIPGTPASAAYTDEAYAMTRKGQAGMALGAGLIFEYFWMAVLGLAGAVFIGSASVLKACVTLLLGLIVSCIGMENPAAAPRFTMGIQELVGGVGLIPMVVGIFAVSEILRNVTALNAPPRIGTEQIGNVFKGMWGLTRRYWVPLLRGSALGTIIGIQPGSGPDMASWMAYATS
jgi:putative tricarboxylic transport membrane protein